MADVFTADKRSAVMRAIRSKNTKPELVVRSALHRLGYRFRLHVPGLPGKPDIVIAGSRTVIQVRGCFWHAHHCLKGRTVHGNRGYWLPKIAGNKARDRRNDAKLRRMGWQVKTIWECRVRRATAASLCAQLSRLLGAESTAILKNGDLKKIGLALRDLRTRVRTDR